MTLTNEQLRAGLQAGRLITATGALACKPADKVLWIGSEASIQVIVEQDLVVAAEKSDLGSGGVLGQEHQTEHKVDVSEPHPHLLGVLYNEHFFALQELFLYSATDIA